MSTYIKKLFQRILISYSMLFDTRPPWAPFLRSGAWLGAVSLGGGFYMVLFNFKQEKWPSGHELMFADLGLTIVLCL